MLETVETAVQSAIRVFGREFAQKSPRSILSRKTFVSQAISAGPITYAQTEIIRIFYKRTICQSPPQARRSNRRSHHTFLGQFPCRVLRLDLNPKAVDVNVHPAKLEVKFSNEKAVFNAVYYGVRNAVEKNVTRPELPAAGIIKQTAFAPPVSRMSVPIRDGSEESLKKRQIEGELFVKSEGKPAEGKIQANASPKGGAFVNITAEEYAKMYIGGALIMRKMGGGTNAQCSRSGTACPQKRTKR